MITTESTPPVPECDRPCRCSNCSWQGRESALSLPLGWIADAGERIEPNEIAPAGECRNCGALAHREMTTGDRASLLRQLVAAGLTLGDVVRCMGIERDANETALQAARQFANDDLEFDDHVFLSAADGGCWVSCWVWVALGPSTTPEDAAAAVR